MVERRVNDRSGMIYDFLMLISTKRRRWVVPSRPVTILGRCRGLLFCVPIVTLYSSDMRGGIQ